MEKREEMMIDGEVYSCLLNEQSVPYDCVRAEVSQPGGVTSGDIAVIVMVSIVSLAVITFVLAYNRRMDRLARKP